MTERWVCDDCGFSTEDEARAIEHADRGPADRGPIATHWLFSSRGRSMHSSDLGGVYVDDAATTTKMGVRPR